MRQDRSVGITFKEQMTGGLALGVSEAGEGESVGRSRGSSLTLHATIQIDDLDRFLTEPAHRARLTGTVDFTPWGDGFDISHGVFNLFKPTDRPSLKLMVYEGAFQHEGKSYYVAGQKDVEDDSILKLWPQTTTLYTRLHAGRDKRGEVVGAGTLHLSVRQLIALVSTLRATGTGSAAEGIEAVARFGRFFMGELWESYVQHLPGRS